MNNKTKNSAGGERVERLLSKIIGHRKKYSASIKGERVFVRPSVPRGGVVDFEILWNNFHQSNGEIIEKEKVLKPTK